MKNYLVIQLARFGDLVQTKRLIATLCAREQAMVHLCVDVSLGPLARIIYPSVIVHEITAHGTMSNGRKAITALLVDNRRAFAKMGSITFEKVYNLNFSPLNFRLAALFDSEIVEGYAWKDGQELTRLWPTMAMRWSEYRRTGINLVDFWAGYCRDMVPPNAVNPLATPKGNGLGIVLAGRESRRSIPVDLLATITATMAQLSKVKAIYLLGGASESSAGLAVHKRLPANLQDITHNLAGKTNWTDLVDIVGSLDGLITPDTGTMHLAAHLGTPVHAFFLSSAWCFETGPYGEGHEVFQGLTDCLPCLESQPCPHDVKCREGFTAPSFQRYLVTRKADHLPANMLVLQSAFDRLGQTYTAKDGSDPDIDQRTQFRGFLADYLFGSKTGFSDMETLFAHRVFKDKDWITQAEPGSTIGL